MNSLPDARPGRDGGREPARDVREAAREGAREPVRRGRAARRTGESALVEALSSVRAAVAATAYPLASPSAGRAQESAKALARQLDDYLLPRLRRLDAPLLAVVGGPTGAGKSTLVNSLIRSPITPAGVLRPTTRAPVLVCHPADAGWFSEVDLLPGLARTATIDDRPGESGPVLRIIPAQGLLPGLGLLDAPDIDSVVTANREVARQLLAAADLWLFVTTAARYADAVPWHVLREARDRGTAVALVLDRVPAGARDDIVAHLRGMLRQRDLADAPLFVVPESTLDGYGMVGELAVAPIRNWIDTIARDSGRRAAMARHTLFGAVAAVEPIVARLAVAADDQVAAGQRLIAVVDRAHAAAADHIDAAVGDGTVLRGQVYTRWQELVANGTLRAAVEAAIPSRKGSDARVVLDRRLPTAIVSTVANLITEAVTTATEQTRAAWRAEPAGRVLLAAEPDLGRVAPSLSERAQQLVTDWQSWLDGEAQSGRERPYPAHVRGATGGEQARTMVVLLATVAPPTGDITAVGPGPDLLRTIVADTDRRALAERAKADLGRRVRELLAGQAERFHHRVAAAGVRVDTADGLREVAGRLAVVRSNLVLGDAA